MAEEEGVDFDPFRETSGRILATYRVYCATEGCEESAECEARSERDFKLTLIESGWGFLGKVGWICPLHASVARGFGVETHHYPIRDKKSPKE